MDKVDGLTEGGTQRVDKVDGLTEGGTQRVDKVAKDDVDVRKAR